jgi:hypothetical protein
MRKTENEIKKLQVAGFYRDVELGEPVRFFTDIEKKKAEEVRFSIQIVERKVAPRAVAIHKLINLSIRVTRDIDQATLLCGFLIETMNGNDREELFKSPVIDQGLEDAKVAKVLPTQLFFELTNLLRWGLAVLIQARNFRNEMPEGVLDTGFCRKIKKS